MKFIQSRVQLVNTMDIIIRNKLQKYNSGDRTHYSRHALYTLVLYAELKMPNTKINKRGNTWTNNRYCILFILTKLDNYNGVTMDIRVCQITDYPTVCSTICLG